MEPIKNFIYNDLILYAKGWYQRSEEILDDLSYIFSKIYVWAPKEETEIAYMMLMALDRLYEMLPQSYMNPHRFYNTHASFEAEINNRKHLYECTRERAIILLVLSIFQGLTRHEVLLNPPYYGRKEHFRMGNLIGPDYPISMTYTTMNRRAIKMFSYDRTQQ